MSDVRTCWVKYTGPDDYYSGYDMDAAVDLRIGKFEIERVSPGKRDQLLASFPGDWQELDKMDPMVSPQEADNVLPVPLQPRQRSPRKTKPANPKVTK